MSRVGTPVPKANRLPNSDSARGQKHSRSRVTTIRRLKAGALCHRRVLVAVAGLVAIALGGWGLLSAIETGPSVAPNSPSAPTMTSWQRHTVKRGLQELKEAGRASPAPLAVMRTSPEAMPPTMRRLIQQTIGRARPLRLQFDRAQLVQIAGAPSIWLVQGRGVTCLFRDRSGSSICQTSVQARKNGLLLETYKTKGRRENPPTNFLALGLAPNWARVAVVRTGGRVRRLKTFDHTYALHAQVPIEVERLLP